MFLTCGSIENLYNRGIAGKKLETQEFLARDYEIASFLSPDDQIAVWVYSCIFLMSTIFPILSNSGQQSYQRTVRSDQMNGSSVR